VEGEIPRGPSRLRFNKGVFVLESTKEQGKGNIMSKRHRKHIIMAKPFPIHGQTKRAKYEWGKRGRLWEN